MKVKDLDIAKEYYLDTYAGRYIKDAQTETDAGNFNAASEILSMMVKGNMSASQSFFESIKHWNDLKSEKIRVEDYGKLELAKRDMLRELYQSNNIGTILMVDNLSDQSSVSYKARLVDAVNEEVLFTLFYSADVQAIQQRKMYEPNNRTIFDVDSYGHPVVIGAGFAKLLITKMLKG